MEKEINMCQISFVKKAASVRNRAQIREQMSGPEIS